MQANHMQSETNILSCLQFMPHVYESMHPPTLSKGTMSYPKLLARDMPLSFSNSLPHTYSHD